MARPPRTPSGGSRLKRKPDRRELPDRRKLTRAGRREADPQPRCPSCGLLVGRPHVTDKECIAALRDVLERLINGAPLDDSLPPAD